MGYSTHYVVDGGKARIILQVLVTPAEVMDNQPMLDLIWRTRFRWKLWPGQATGDRKYGTEENILALEGQLIRAFLPQPDNDHRTAFFGPEHFRYEPERDAYVCPNGKELRFDHSLGRKRALRYRARAKDCNQCPLKADCTASLQGRTLTRSTQETLLERVRSSQNQEPYQKALRKRQVWVEPLFAEGKDWHGMRRFRLRRLWRVNSEALLRAAGQNLKRLLKQRGWGRRPFPIEAVALMPAESGEAEEFPRNPLWRNQRASTAVASLASWKVAWTSLEAQMSSFSPVYIVIIIHFCYDLNSNFILFFFLYFF